MLKLSKKADYALMALHYMASVQFGDLTEARVVNTKEVAEEYHIPVELLAKVLLKVTMVPKVDIFWLVSQSL